LEIARGARRLHNRLILKLGHYQSLYELENFDYDDIKAEVDLDGRKHTVSLSKPSKMRFSFDVTDDVSNGPDGYPRPSVLVNKAKELTKTLAKQANVQI